jgi:hypothetical protein
MIEPNTAAELVKANPELALAAYRDLVSRPAKEAGKLGEDIAKAARLVLFPIQFAAAFQDRLEGYINRAIRKVPEPRLIAPVEIDPAACGGKA